MKHSCISTTWQYLGENIHRLTWLRPLGGDTKAMWSETRVNRGDFCNHGLLGHYNWKWPRLRYAVPDSHCAADSSGPEFYCFCNPSTVSGSQQAFGACLLYWSQLKSLITNSVAQECPLRRQFIRALPGQHKSILTFQVSKTKAYHFWKVL